MRSDGPYRTPGDLPPPTRVSPGITWVTLPDGLSIMLDRIHEHVERWRWTPHVLVREYGDERIRTRGDGDYECAAGWTWHVTCVEADDPRALLDVWCNAQHIARVGGSHLTTGPGTPLVRPWRFGALMPIRFDYKPGRHWADEHDDATVLMRGILIQGGP